MIRKVIRTLLSGLVVIFVIGILTTPALALVLWVVPENPTEYLGVNNEQYVLSEVVIEKVNMGTSFSGSILVLYQAGPIAIADDVYLKFFVEDASNINDINIGTAKRIQKISPYIIDENPGSDSSNQILHFNPVLKDEPVPEGFGVTYLIGDIPFSGGPDETGNVDDGTFNQDGADYYIKVPFTINFINTPEIGFNLYVYAENELTGKDEAKTAYSHDGVYYHTPEFSTIALPIAAILGIMFILQSRRRKED